MEERIKRFGKVEPLKEKYKSSVRNSRRGREYDSANEDSDDDVKEIKPKKDKEEYKIKIDETAELDKRRVFYILKFS